MITLDCFIVDQAKIDIAWQKFLLICHSYPILHLQIINYSNSLNKSSFKYLKTVITWKTTTVVLCSIVGGWNYENSCKIAGYSGTKMVIVLSNNIYYKFT